MENPPPPPEWNGRQTDGHRQAESFTSQTIEWPCSGEVENRYDKARK